MSYTNAQTALKTILENIYDSDCILQDYNMDVWTIMQSTATSFDDGVVISDDGYDIEYGVETQSQAFMTEKFTLWVKTIDDNYKSKLIAIINLLLNNSSWEQTDVGSAVFLKIEGGKSEFHEEQEKWFSINLTIG